MRFRGEFAFLSNFYPAEVSLDGKTYPTVENAYQAAKTKGDRSAFVSCSPSEAKRLGRTITIRPDWDEVKVQVMAFLLRQKFSDEAMRAKLCAIEGLIVEENHWGDRFWGVCNGRGRNVLGRLLMEIRSGGRPPVAVCDITTIPSGFVAHVVNDSGVMGAGVAKAIAERWPAAKAAYIKASREGRLALGTVIGVRVGDVIVANMVAQHGYGRDGRRYLDYEAFAECLDKVQAKAKDLGLQLFMPYGIGCGLAGGEWEIVSSLIAQHAPDAVLCTKPDERR